jgi:hypothetical protein
VLPATAGAAVDLIARWLRERRLPPAEVLLTPTSFPAESTLEPPPGTTSA